MKKKYLIIFCIVIIFCIAVILIMFITSNKNKSSKNEVIIRDVNLETVDELVIGSEPPKILYADKEKVIFNCRGIYVYDMKNKILTHSFDISASASKTYRKWSSFVSENGNQIIYILVENNDNSYVRYCYDFESDCIEEISEEESTDYRKKAFECTILEYNDDLYEKSAGRIVNISESEYVYLTFQDWLLSTIEIVYVSNGIETYYSVFDGQ